jgi:hypothetical protein
MGGDRPVTIVKRRAGRGRWYTVDGEKYDGVTTLIKNGIPKPGLINWAANTTAGYAVDNWDELSDLKVSERLKRLQGCRFEDRDEAANRGTEIHELAERLMHGEQVEVPEEIAGHVDSLVAFLDEWRPRPILTEFVVAHRRWVYCGTGDTVAELPGGEIAYLDYKTARTGIFGETALQAAAYMHAEVYVDPAGSERPVSQLGVTAAYGVWVRADGYDVYPLDISDQAFKTFLHAAFIARKAENLRDLVGRALPTPKAAATT